MRACVRVWCASLSASLPALLLLLLLCVCARARVSVCVCASLSASLPSLLEASSMNCTELPSTRAP